MINRDPAKTTVVEKIGAAVADIHHRCPVPSGYRGNKRCPHAVGIFNRPGFTGDALVGKLDSGTKHMLGTSPGVPNMIAEQLDCKPTRPVASGVSSHAIADNQQQPVHRRFDTEEILVALATQSDMRPRCHAETGCVYGWYVRFLLHGLLFAAMSFIYYLFTVVISSASIFGPF
jgi:hypothetical protein